MTSDDEGNGGVMIPPKNDDVIYEQPLMPSKQNILSFSCSAAHTQVKNQEYLLLAKGFLYS